MRELTGVPLSGEERNPGLGCGGQRLSGCGPAVGELGRGRPVGWGEPRGAGRGLRG